MEHSFSFQATGNFRRKTKLLLRGSQKFALFAPEFRGFRFSSPLASFELEGSLEKREIII